MIQFASGPCNGLCCCLICLLPSSCFPALPTIVIPLCWGDTQSSFCSAKCLVQLGSGALLMETNLHIRPPAAFSCLPACQAWGESLLGCGQGHRSCHRGQSCAHFWRPVGNRGSGRCWGREHSSFTTCGWWGCGQGPSAPSRQLARSAVFAESVKRTHFMGDIYHYPVLLKYSLCSRLELVRLLSSQVGG